MDLLVSGSAFYDWFGLNKSLFLIMNKIHAPILDQFVLLITWLGHPRLFPFYITLALLITWRWPETLPQRNVVVFAFSYIIASMLLVPWLKDSLAFPRPLTVLGQQAVIMLGNPDQAHSFPSGHSAYAVLMAAALSRGMPFGGKLVLAVFAFLVCISRIVVGAHFPADVAGGAAIALLVVLAVRFMLMFLPGEKAYADAGRK